MHRNDGADERKCFCCVFGKPRSHGGKKMHARDIWHAMPTFVIESHIILKSKDNCLREAGGVYSKSTQLKQA